MAENVDKKPPYYRTITVRHHEMESAIAELDRKSNVYEKENTVLHRDFSLVYGFQVWVAARSFCCETKEGDGY